jgi:hypothetical protein
LIIPTITGGMIEIINFRHEDPIAHLVFLFYSIFAILDQVFEKNWE